MLHFNINIFININFHYQQAEDFWFVFFSEKAKNVETLWSDDRVNLISLLSSVVSEWNQINKLPTVSISQFVDSSFSFH